MRESDSVLFQNITDFGFNLDDAWDEGINGISISTLNTRDYPDMPKSIMNGVAVNIIYTKFREVNGIACGFIGGDFSETTNGLSLGVLFLSGERRNGITAAPGVVLIHQMNGISLGMINHCDTANGIQFGLFNSARTLYGIQIGILNHAENSILPWFPFVNLVLN